MRLGYHPITSTLEAQSADPMTKFDCNYQRRMDPAEAASALAEACCYRCGVSARALMNRGDILEVCGEEFSRDLVSWEAVLVPIALCPDCHRTNHLDGRNRHNPCQIKARLSRESF